MVIKEKIQETAQVEATKIYEIYKEVIAEKAAGGAITILQLERTTTKLEVERNIASYEAQIASMTSQKEAEEAILAQLI